MYTFIYSNLHSHGYEDVTIHHQRTFKNTITLLNFTWSLLAPSFSPAGAIHQQPRHCSNKHTSYSKLVHSICVIDTLLHVLISNNITQINKTEDCYIPQSIVVTVKLLTCILNRVPVLCILNVFMKIFYTAMILHKCVARFVIVS